jgi:hypothetical protein
VQFEVLGDNISSAKFGSSFFDRGNNLSSLGKVLLIIFPVDLRHLSWCFLLCSSSSYSHVFSYERFLYLHRGFRTSMKMEAVRMYETSVPPIKRTAS